MKILQRLLLLIVTPLLLAAQCEKENLDIMPPATQEGKNTFGCYVNNELFVAAWKYSPWGRDYLSALFSRERNILEINAYAKNGTICLQIINPEEGKPIPLLYASYIVDNLSYQNVNDIVDNKLQEKIKIGEMYITKFDLVNIISGTFSCEIKLKSEIGEADDASSTVKITEGRFDINRDRVYTVTY